MQDTNSGWIYVLTQDSEHFKIGKAKDLDDRVKQLKIQLPYKVKVHCAFYVDDRHKAESQIHRQLKGYRLNGEWFQFDQQSVKQMYGVLRQAGLSFENGYEERSGKYVAAAWADFAERAPHSPAYRKAGMRWLETQCVIDSLEVFNLKPNQYQVAAIYLTPVSNVSR